MIQSLQLRMGQQLSMTPQLQQAIKLLQLSTLDLQQEIQQRLDKGETQLLHQLTPLFEAVALKAALEKTVGKKKEAADLLGWGRNTLARKMKEFDL